MKATLSFVFCLAACSGSCGSELPSRTSAALGRPAPPLQERVPEVDAVLPAPVCEASALLMLSDHTWLVADNEIHEHLFGFTRAFDEAAPFEMPGGHRPRDIEALARVGEDEFLVVGSHSNRRDGSLSEKRHRLRWLRFVGHNRGTEETHYSGTSEGSWHENVDGCRTELFEASALDQAAPLVDEFCRALDVAGEMDIEGAASVDGHVWLGFRRPQIEGHAVIARLSGHQLRFDEMTTVDLGGRGVRAMDSYDEQLYVVGGPSEDGLEDHVLFLVDGFGGDAAGPEQAVELAVLPPYAEGLAIHSPGHALIVTDGATGRVTCDEPSRVKTITFNVPASSPSE